jgi:protein SCO1/2
MKKIILLGIICLSLFAQEVKKEDVRVGVYEKLGQTAAVDTVFTDSTNVKKTIAQIMNGRPTIISMNYYKCPGICTSQFAAVASLVDRLDVPLDEYQFITVSIEPEDTIELAAEKKKTFFESLILKPNLPKEKWNFLVGDQENITKFADSIGYEYLKQTNTEGVVDYLHPGTLIVLSASGKITRYIYGISYSHFDVKLALNEADEGRVSAARVQALKLCFAYDAEAKKYVFLWEKVVGGGLFFMVLCFFIYLTITGRKK